MVIAHNISRYAALVLTAFIFSSCGIGYYNDFGDRFAQHNDFFFLSESDRALTLGETYSFIVLSDTHISGSAESFAQLKNHLDGAQFAVVTGDITQNGTEPELRLFIEAAAAFGVPVYPVIGNHDVYTARAAAWKKLIGSSSYRIDSAASSTSLFILDNANASFGHNQIAWFQNELKTAKKRTFVFAHDNFFVESSPPDIEHTVDINERALVISLLSKKCDILFMGHLHKRITKEYSGCAFVMNEDYYSSKTICRVTVSPNGVKYAFEQL